MSLVTSKQYLQLLQHCKCCEVISDSDLSSVSHHTHVAMHVITFRMSFLLTIQLDHTLHIRLNEKKTQHLQKPQDSYINNNRWMHKSRKLLWKQYTDICTENNISIIAGYVLQFHFVIQIFKQCVFHCIYCTAIRQ